MTNGNQLKIFWNNGNFILKILFRGFPKKKTADINFKYAVMFIFFKWKQLVCIHIPCSFPHQTSIPEVEKRLS